MEARSGEDTVKGSGERWPSKAAVATGGAESLTAGVRWWVSGRSGLWGSASRLGLLGACSRLAAALTVQS